MKAATFNIRQIRAKWTVTTGRRGGMLIKGEMHNEPDEGLFPGFSASGQDVWVEEAQYDEPGIVVSAVGARCGKAFKADGRWTAIANTHVLIPRFGFDRDYLWWVFNNEEFWLKGGSAQPYVQFDDSLERVIPIAASESEQQAIAGYLDRETGRLDALVAEKERWLDLLAEKRRALITRAVTRGLNPTAPLHDSGIPWLGQIPAQWLAMRLRFLGRCKGGAGFPHEEQGIQGAELPFFKVKDLAQQNADAYLRETDNSVSRETAENLRAMVFPKDTIVFAKVGAALLLERFKLLAQPSCIDNNMMGFVVDGTKIDVLFALHAFSLFKFGEIVNPGAVPSMNEEQVNDLSVPVPPTLDEQCAIVAHICSATAKLDGLRAATERTIALLKERRAALIAAAVTGKIEVGRAKR